MRGVTVGVEVGGMVMVARAWAADGSPSFVVSHSVTIYHNRSRLDVKGTGLVPIPRHGSRADAAEVAPLVARWSSCGMRGLPLHPRGLKGGSRALRQPTSF